MSSLTYEIVPHVPMSDPLMVEFDKALTALDTHTPLQYFRWTQQATPTVYDYRIRDAIGRDWIQVYDYADPIVADSELPSAKTSGDAWSLAEIDLHRRVRAVLLLIVARHSVTTLRATFT